MSAMQKIEREATALGLTQGFTFIGDPGCDGLGVETMSVFNAACHEAAGDFILIGGDIVPEGTGRFYQKMIDMIDSAVRKPVYMLPGNHDTMDYETYFGMKNYFLYDSKLLLVVLDNSGRVFPREALELLGRALRHERDNIVVAFHIPPPNSVSQNSVSAEEWAKVRGLISPVRDKLKYIVCGHVHSYFEDEVDGIKLVVSGGGGARIEEVEGVPNPFHHSVEFSFDPSGNLRHALKRIEYDKLQRPAPAVMGALKEAYAGKCIAVVRYRLYEEEAAKNGKPHLAKLFAAVAESELRHAGNFLRTMARARSQEEALANGIESKLHKANNVYPNGRELSKSHNAWLAAYAFNDAAAAEEAHLRLFKEAKELLADNRDIPEKRYFTCTFCGYTMTDGQGKTKCPICGAPPGRIS